jgi:hypothetical protein
MQTDAPKRRQLTDSSTSTLYTQEPKQKKILTDTSSKEIFNLPSNKESKSATKIQSVVRGHKGRESYVDKQASSLLNQVFDSIYKENKSATKIQSVVRGH